MINYSAEILLSLKMFSHRANEHMKKSHIITKKSYKDTYCINIAKLYEKVYFESMEENTRNINNNWF